jgi:hypothetical protein
MFVENEEDEAQTVEDLGVENNKPFDFLAFVRRSSECKTHDCSVRLKTLGQIHKRTTVLLFKKNPDTGRNSQGLEICPKRSLHGSSELKVAHNYSQRSMRSLGSVP